MVLTLRLNSSFNNRRGSSQQVRLKEEGIKDELAHLPLGLLVLMATFVTVRTDLYISAASVDNGKRESTHEGLLFKTVALKPNEGIILSWSNAKEASLWFGLLAGALLAETQCSTTNTLEEF